MDGVTSDDGVRRYYGKYPGRVLHNETTGGAHRGAVVIEVGGLLEDEPQGSGRRALQVTARPCLPPGLFWVPEPGQPVWVEFVAGRLDEAVWSGVWYATDATPRTVDGEAPTANQKLLRTAAGHVVQLEDATGDGKEPGAVTVLDARGNRVVLAKQRIEVHAARGQDGDSGDGKAEVRLAAGDEARIVVQNDGTTQSIVLTAGKAEISVSPDGVSITDGTNVITVAAAQVTINDHLVALDGLLDIFKNHLHATAMGPAALSPADVVKCAQGDAAGTALSRARAK
ncbi:hypothetical protein [Actinoplanes awajinensis]|uniref:Gp5/Type VI secretion system Vgr protein OB-fold domain-containing protein n=1 Tax=Actinoplanes awajinensis subsp. mycoplanecinus TaxID=135947 RepID=A0A124G8C7_9ACTN|nr:hypothetical protein [Actinoplanes awajinensis]KUL25597.1 hypothetical protein ADL15_40340 [Actinoplanes awajinensis subsp. mycoplanecinus]